MEFHASLWFAAVLSLAHAQVTTSISCRNKCTYNASQPRIACWHPLTFDATITAATLVAYVDTILSTTMTSTIYNDLENYTSRPTNAAGTITSTLTYTRQGVVSSTVLAYPTLFVEWPDAYTWLGELITTATIVPFETTCQSIATSSTITFAGYPQPTFGPAPVDATFPAFTIPSNSYYPSVVDYEGHYFALNLDRFGDIILFEEAFPDEGAIQNCPKPPGRSPSEVWDTALFVTASTTIYMGNRTPHNSPSVAPGSIPTSAQPAPTMPASTPTPSPGVPTSAALPGPKVGGGDSVSISETTIGMRGTTTVYGGTTMLVGGSTGIEGGRESVIGGTTTIYGGTTLLVDGSTSVDGGILTTIGGSTVTIGGSTVLVQANTIVVGGSTSIQDGAIKVSTATVAAAASPPTTASTTKTRNSASKKDVRCGMMAFLMVMVTLFVSL